VRTRRANARPPRGTHAKKAHALFPERDEDSARLTAPAPRSAALVSQEHAHRLSGQSNHVVSAFDRRRRSNKQMSPSDWAHRLPEAETGCLLLAPETEEGWWRHSVVLVLNHDNQGSTGVILNRPTNAHLHQVVPEIDYDAPHHKVLANRQVRPSHPRLSRCAPRLPYPPARHATLFWRGRRFAEFPRKPRFRAFSVCPPASTPPTRSTPSSHPQVSMGGPMGTEKGSRCLVALSHRPLQGATSEVFPGLWHVSDFSAVRPEHEPFLSVFVGYCGWMEGQLNAEVAADGWTVAAASASNTLGLVNNPKAGDLMGESMWASMRQRLGLAPSV